MNKTLQEAHKHSTNNRREIEMSVLCGCFYCRNIFLPSHITKWTDNDDTAICPVCGVDSILGDKSDFPITKEFLAEMRKCWF